MSVVSCAQLNEVVSRSGAVVGVEFEYEVSYHVSVFAHTHVDLRIASARVVVEGGGKESLVESEKLLHTLAHIHLYINYKLIITN